MKTFSIKYVDFRKKKLDIKLIKRIEIFLRIKKDGTNSNKKIFEKTYRKLI